MTLVTGLAGGTHQAALTRVASRMQGYTDTTTGKSHKFPAILGEFGSFMNDSSDSCASNGCLAEEGRVSASPLNPPSSQT